jgi:hypothetical protein
MNAARNPAVSVLVAGWLLLAAPAVGRADDPGARAVQQQQLQRQQQQESLQLRMQQQQRAVQSPPQNAEQRQALERLQIERRQRQQALHYRQGIEFAARRPAGDAATRRAQEDIERMRANEQGEALLRRPEAGQQPKR